MRNGYFNGELTEREIEVEKEIRRENIKEAIALIIAVPLFVLLFWLFLVGTPNQMSAEADMAAVGRGDAPHSENGGKNSAAQVDDRL